MKTSAIVVGTEYALDLKGTSNPSRVRVLSTTATRRYRDSSYFRRTAPGIEVLYLNRETGEPRTRWGMDKEEPMKEVIRPAEITRTWEEHLPIQEAREAERARRKEAQVNAYASRDEAIQRAKNLVPEIGYLQEIRDYRIEISVSQLNLLLDAIKES